MTARPKPPRTDLSGLCAVCGTRIDPVAGTVHPLCEPGVMERFHRAEARAAIERGNKGKRRALLNNKGAKTLGLQLIRAAAARQPYLSADDLRDTLEVAGINTSKAAGGLWSAAAAAGIVEKVAEAPSGGASAHGKKINQYRSLIYRGAA